MKDGCGCMGRPQEQEKPLDGELTEVVVKGKRERQVVLQRVRRQRGVIMKRLATKLGRV
jgi:hypothetical protein